MYLKQLFSYLKSHTWVADIKCPKNHAIVIINYKHNCSNSKKFTIGSLYRPGTAHPNLNASEQFSQFLELFSSISDCATRKSYPVFIFGDTNIDCKKYNSSPNSTEFVDLLFFSHMTKVKRAIFSGFMCLVCQLLLYILPGFSQCTPETLKHMCNICM